MVDWFTKIKHYINFYHSMSVVATNRVWHSLKSHIFSSTTSQKIAAPSFSLPGYPSDIAVTFPKANTFPDHRSKVRLWWYFALKKPQLHDNVQLPPARRGAVPKSQRQISTSHLIPVYITWAQHKHSHIIFRVIE